MAEATKTRKSSKSKAAAVATVNAPQTTSEPQQTATEQTANAPPAAAEQQKPQEPLNTATAEEAAKEAAERKAAVQDAAVSIMAQAVTAFRKGESGYRAGLLETGRLVSEYLSLRLSIGDNRAAAVKTVEGQLNAYASQPVSAYSLVSAWQSFRLFAIPAGLTVEAENCPPYGYFVRGFASLTVRDTTNATAEVWTVKPGIEEEAAKLFADTLANGLAREAVEEACRKLADRAAELHRERMKSEAEALRKATEEQRRKEEEAAADRKEAERKAKEAAIEHEKAAAIQNAEERARIAAKAEQAKQDLLEKQRREIEEQAKRMEMERETLRKERAEKEAAERAKDAAERKLAKERGKSDKPQPPIPSAPTRESFLKMGSTATAKDAAEMVRGFILETSDPSATLEATIRSLMTEQKLSVESRKACAAFVTLLAKVRNGQPSLTAKEAAEAALATN